MLKVLEYYSRFQSFRGRVIQLPGWSRVLLFIAALPGILLISLSIAALLVSISGLLLLTVPLYKVLRATVGTEGPAESFAAGPTILESASPSSSGRRHVDVKIIE